MRKLVSILNALSDPIRLRIINLLYPGELCVCKIVGTLSFPQSTISRHLTILKNAGLVEDTKKGKWSFYKLTIADKNFIKILIEEELLHNGSFLKDIELLQNNQRGEKHD